MNGLVPDTTPSVTFWSQVVPILQQLFAQPNINDYQWALFLYPDPTGTDYCVPPFQFPFESDNTAVSNAINNLAQFAPNDHYGNSPSYSPLQLINTTKAANYVIWISSDAVSSCTTTLSDGCNNPHSDYTVVPHEEEIALVQDLYTINHIPTFLLTWTTANDANNEYKTNLAIAGGVPNTSPLRFLQVTATVQRSSVPTTAYYQVTTPTQDWSLITQQIVCGDV
jgi:hypothetical protein